MSIFAVQIIIGLDNHAKVSFLATELLDMTALY